MTSENNNSPTKLMEQPKFYRLQIIIPVLASLAAVAFTTGYNDFYNKPDIQIEINLYSSGVTVNLTNSGRAPATDMTLSVKTPKSIVDYQYFSTENLTIAKSVKLDPTLFSAHIPRFVHGQGAYAAFDIITAGEDNTTLTPNDLVVYATYDEGSIRLPRIQNLSFLSTITFIILYVILAIIIALIIRYFYMKINERSMKIRLLAIVPKIRKDMEGIKKTIKEKSNNKEFLRHKVHGLNHWNNFDYDFKRKILNDDFVYFDTFYKTIVEHDNKVYENKLIETKELININNQVMSISEDGLYKIEWERYGIKYE
jgi:hypothetical protein